MAFQQVRDADASFSTFNQVQGDQYNYHAERIILSTSDNDLRKVTRDVVKWLYPVPFDIKHQYTSTKGRQPGTGLWLLEDERFEAWLSTPGSFLWLYGIPGSGKTVLTSTLIDHFQSLRTPNCGFAYFYFDFTETKTRQPKSLLRSLLAQLLMNQPKAIRADFDDLVRRMHDNYQPPSDLTELADLIAKASSQYEDTTLVIDALDECAPRNELLQCFDRLRVKGNIRIFITSRKEKDIRDAFRKQATISLGEEAQHVLADMKKHVSKELEGEAYAKIPQRMKDIILTTLIQGADGMFRWIQCQLDRIRTIRTNKKIMESLKNLPTGLYETYERILQNITEDDRWFAQKILSWTIASDRPLRLAEIVEGMAVDLEGRCLDRDSSLNDKEDILEICSSLVEYREQSDDVILSHYSVQEFLLSSHLEKTPLSAFRISLHESHRELSKICLTYLLLDHFQDGACDTKEAFDCRVVEYPLLDYAAKRWMVHTEECRGAEDIIPLITEFLASEENGGLYLNYMQAQHGDISGYFPDKSPLSWLTNGRLTWILRCLFKNPPSWLNDELGRHGTPLNNAVVRDDLEMINYLIDAGVDINKPSDHHVFQGGVFPLWLAVLNGYHQSFDLLLERGADPCWQYSGSRDTALHEACTQGNVRMVEKLVARGADVNQRNLDGLTPLHMAVRGGSLETTRFLVDRVGAEVFSRAHLGSVKTAVHYAIELQSPSLTEYLLSRSEETDFICLRDLNAKQIEWAKGEPWYPRLVSHTIGDIGSLRFFTEKDVNRVRRLLEGRLGLHGKIVVMILEHAAYWARNVVKRADLLVVDCNTVPCPYLSIPVGGRGLAPLRRLVIRTRSHDQGFSSYPDLHGTYRESWTWFEVRVRRPARSHNARSIGVSNPSHLPRDRRFQINVHASWETREHTNIWDVRDQIHEIQEWLGAFQVGDMVEVFALAQFPAWQNWVESVEMEMYCAWGE